LVDLSIGSASAAVPLLFDILFTNICRAPDSFIAGIVDKFMS
jgi:hypothetical protein